MTDIAQRIGVTIQNDSEMDIPSFSIVVVTSVEVTLGDEWTDSVAIHHVDQYGCGKRGNVMVTGEVTIPAGTTGDNNGDPSTGASFGIGFFDPFTYVAIDTEVAPPAVGEQWGPSDGSWVVTRGGTGFFAQGDTGTDDEPSTAMFLRTFVRAPATICSSSFSVATSSSSGSSGSTSVSGSSSVSTPCDCIGVVTFVSCIGNQLNVIYGNARGCC